MNATSCDHSIVVEACTCNQILGTRGSRQYLQASEQISS